MQPSDGKLRIGLVGPGRTRNGLGPFLARHLAHAGASVVAVAGRTPARTAAAADDLARDLGHPVDAHTSVAELAGRGDLAALVIAAPIVAHLDALRTALDARLPTLCEKPLVDVHEHAAALEVVQGFVRAEVPIVENCQWPLALAALRARGVLDGAPPAEFEMRLSPAGSGRAMLVDSLSHFLSVLQALYDLDVDADTRVLDVRFSTRSDDATELTLELALRTAGGEAATRLSLVRCPQQPRPAWLAFDGRRFARQLVLPAYHWQFVDERDPQSAHAIGDPQADLVYSFVELLTPQEPDLVRSHAAAITTRARFFAALVEAFDRPGGG